MLIAQKEHTYVLHGDLYVFRALVGMIFVCKVTPNFNARSAPLPLVRQCIIFAAKEQQQHDTGSCTIHYVLGGIILLCPSTSRRNKAILAPPAIA
jgi:hypothetical protein